MTAGPRSWYRPRRDGLAVRVAAFLTVALLPLGLIAIHQTREFQRESEERASLSLLATTGQSAAAVKQSIERALGAAESLGLVADILGDPATCSAALRRYLAGPAGYAFVGLLPGEGPVVCSSAGAPFELSDREDWAGLLADPRPRVRADPEGRISGRDVLIVLSPILSAAGDGRASGYVGLSLPRDRVVPVPSSAVGARPLRLLTFNAEGAVLTSQAVGAGRGDLAPLLPEGRALADEATGVARSFVGQDAMGRERLYTVTPLIPGVAYAMGIWSPLQAARAGEGMARAPLLFPILMWGAGLVMAFWAIHRLVIRRVADLGARMRQFGRDRRLVEGLPVAGAAFELRQIDEAFREAAEAILRDEARMENAFRERGILLKEVHHRVKNNLQLISSIISMQVRRAPEPATRAILRRLQDRVLTLATIYRVLYTSPDMTEVDAAEVLRSVVSQVLRDRAGAADIDLDVEAIVLDPDKVVPLAFLAAEAVANGLAHAGDADGRARLSVSLSREGGMATLAVTNAWPGPAGSAADPAPGLGQQLIRAFANQAEGSVSVSTEGGVYRIGVTFPIATGPAERAA